MNLYQRNLSDEKNLLESKIRHKKELMEKKGDDFNYHTREARRLERVVHNLWVEINIDQRKLADMETKLRHPLNHVS